jgi:hypothetical protein
MERRLPLLRELETHADPAIAALAKADGALLQSEIQRQREREREDRASDERFEASPTGNASITASSAPLESSARSALVCVSRNSSRSSAYLRCSSGSKRGNT